MVVTVFDPLMAIYYLLLGVILGIGLMQVYLHFNPYYRIYTMWKPDWLPDKDFIERGILEGKTYTDILAAWRSR